MLFGVFLILSALFSLSFSLTCIKVTTLGTGPGPAVPKFDVRGPSNLFEIGNETNDCSGFKILIETPRGVVQGLGNHGVNPNELDLVLLTHLHSDHTSNAGEVIHSGLLDALLSPVYGQSYPVWNFFCPAGPTCNNVNESIQAMGADIESRQEALAALMVDWDPRNQFITTPLHPTNEIEEGVYVNTEHSLSIDIIRIEHGMGNNSVSYKINTPVGSVVFTGDGSITPNITDTAVGGITSNDNVKRFANGTDMVVFNVFYGPAALAIPPNPGPLPFLFPAIHINSSLIGGLVQEINVPVTVLTHLMPALGQQRILGIGTGTTGVDDPLTADHYEYTVRQGGYNNEVRIAYDGMTLTYGNLGVASFDLVHKFSLAVLEPIVPNGSFSCPVGQPLAIRANVDGSVGDIDYVEMRLNDGPLKNEYYAPYTYHVSHLFAGEYIVYARACNSQFCGFPQYATFTVV